MIEQLGYDQLRVVFLWLESGAVVELFVQELFCFAPVAVNFRTENREPLRPLPNVFEAVDSRLANAFSGGFNQAGHKVIQHPLKRLVELEFGGGVRMLLVDFPVEKREAKHQPENFVDGQKPGFEAIVKVG